MNGKSVSVIQALRLVDVEYLKAYYVNNMRAYVSLNDEAAEAVAIPGTVTISSSQKNDFITNEITFKRSDLTAATLAQLTRLRTRRLVAFYRDAMGNERVCGSPTWPLSLSFVAEADGLSVSLKGSDTGPDPMLLL